MINMPPQINYANTSVLGGDLVNQVIYLYNQDPELGKELAIAALIFVATGGQEIVSDNILIKMSLMGSQTFVEKNASKYIEKQGAIEAKEIQDKRLGEIAALLRQGLSQAAAARQLNIAKSTMSDRCKIIKSKYPHLLELSSGQPLLQNPDNSDETLTHQQYYLSHSI